MIGQTQPLHIWKAHAAAEVDGGTLRSVPQRPRKVEMMLTTTRRAFACLAFTTLVTACASEPPPQAVSDADRLDGTLMAAVDR